MSDPITAQEHSMYEYCSRSIGPIPHAESYAWPGGYSLAYLMDDGGTLCADCMNDPRNPVHMGGPNDGWRFEASFIHYEGAPLMCDHCNTEIESAYGEVDEC
jgi:hypothetical protein